MSWPTYLTMNRIGGDRQHTGGRRRNNIQTQIKVYARPIPHRLAPSSRQATAPSKAGTSMRRTSLLISISRARTLILYVHLASENFATVHPSLVPPKAPPELDRSGHTSRTMQISLLIWSTTSHKDGVGAIGSIAGDDITVRPPQHMHPPFNTAGHRHFKNKHSVVTGEYLDENSPRMRPSRESASLLCTPPGKDRYCAPPRW